MYKRQVYGGIIVGALVGILYCRIKKLPCWEYFDLLAPSIAVAQGFGRIGCFLAGCCYGRPTDTFWGVTFPEGSFAPAGVPLIPTPVSYTHLDVYKRQVYAFILTYPFP